MPEFLTAMEKGATVQSKHPNYGRQGNKRLLSRHMAMFLITTKKSVNHTLDYAYSDFCISQVAKRY